MRRRGVGGGRNALRTQAMETGGVRNRVAEGPPINATVYWAYVCSAYEDA